MANPQQTTENKPTAARYRWLLNHGESVRGFAMPSKWSEASKTLTPDAHVLTLAVGPNVIESRKWDALKDKEKAAGDKLLEAGELDAHHAEIHRLLTAKIPRATHANRRSENEGKFYLVEGPAVANPKAPLEGLSESDALAIVEEMIEEGMVRLSLAVEKRPAVNEALHGKLALLTRGLGAAVG